MFKGLRRSLFFMGIGALLAYLWDSERGEERRAQLMEQVQGLRDQSQGLMQQGQGFMQQGQGILQQGQQKAQQLKDTVKNAQNGGSSATDTSAYSQR